MPPAAFQVDFSYGEPAANTTPARIVIGCPADFDGDGFTTGADFDLYVQAFESGDAAADFDGNGFLTGIDFYVKGVEGKVPGKN